MAYSLTTDYVGASPITQADDVQRAVLGLRVTAFDPTYGQGDFIYLQNGTGGSITVGQTGIYDEKLGTVSALTVAASRGPVAVAMAATLTTLQYGWFQVQGSAVVKSATVAANTAAYSTATGGTIDDAVVAGSGIDGMTIKTADGTPSAGFCVAQLAYPCMNSR